MDSHNFFATLRDTLATFYPEEQDSRVVVADAGLDSRRIAFSARAQTNWHNILAEAIGQNRLDKLFQAVRSIYSNNPTFQAAYADYCLFVDQGGKIEALVPLAVQRRSSETVDTDVGSQISINNVDTRSGDFTARDKATFNTFITVAHQTVNDGAETVRQDNPFNWKSDWRKAVRSFLESETDLLSEQNRDDQKLGDQELKNSKSEKQNSLEIIKLYIENIGKEWQDVNWEQIESLYYERLIRKYSTIRVLGKSDPVILEGIFTDVYTLDKVTALQRYDLNKLRERGYERFTCYYGHNKRFNGLELVKKGNNLYILGKPGAGKTTFLKYITLQITRQHKRDRVPIFISLHELVNSRYKELHSFIIDQLGLTDVPNTKLFIEALLLSGKVLMLFDGLDEVRQEGDQRQHLTHLLQNFAHRYPWTQCLITCRIAANEYQFQGFKDVELADFTSDQVNIFTHKWFNGNSKIADDFLIELDKPDNVGLKELQNIPLLLSLLCLAYEANLSFPPQRAEVYKDALESLLRKWDSNRAIRRDEIYHNLSHERKMQMFAFIAAESFNRGEYYFAEDWLIRKISEFMSRLPFASPRREIDGYAILKAIEAQHGIFIERAQRIYSFSHLTFHEYFTARHIVENEVRGTINELIDHHLTDDSWREVLLLTVSSLANANDFVSRICQVIANISSSSTELTNLLTWAANKTAMANSLDHQQKVLRLAYIFLTLAWNQSRSNFRSRCLNLDLARTIDLNFSRGFELAHAINFVQSNDFDLTLDFVREYNPSLALDYGLLHVWQFAALFASSASYSLDVYSINYSDYFDQILQLSKKAQDHRCYNNLVQLSIPNSQATQTEWLHFSYKLSSVMCNYPLT